MSHDHDHEHRHDDAAGGAHNYHDANFLTFHRFTNFRTRTPSDPVSQVPP